MPDLRPTFGIGFKVRGTSFHSVLRTVQTKLRKVTGPSAEAGLIVYGETVKRTAVGFAPKDTGFLRNSAYVVSLSQGRNRGRRVEVGFRAFYALWQHENLEWRHPVGGAKFLEKALIRHRNTAPSIVGKEIRRREFNS